MAPRGPKKSKRMHTFRVSLDYDVLLVGRMDLGVSRVDAEAIVRGWGGFPSKGVCQNQTLSGH